MCLLQCDLSIIAPFSLALKKRKKKRPNFLKVQISLKINSGLVTCDLMVSVSLTAILLSLYGTIYFKAPQALKEYKMLLT